MSDPSIPIDSPGVAACALAACRWEATAPKPGNVHPGAGFEDLTFADMIAAGEAIAPVLAQAGRLGVGETVLAAVEAARRAVPTNANLGIVLLLAPMAAVPAGEHLRSGIGDVLHATGVADAAAVYRAIRLASPGGLGQAAEQDVAAEPTIGLVDAMRMAADRDSVARQHATGFADVFDFGLPTLKQALAARGVAATDIPAAPVAPSAEVLCDAIVELHLAWMARHPDSHIARRRGVEVATRVQAEAGAVLCRIREARQAELAGDPGGQELARRAAESLAGFDAGLREAPRRNPGTSADLTAAVLFAAFRTAMLRLP